MLLFLPFLLSLISCVILIPIVRKSSLRSGHVSQPRNDRWNRNPVATLGGIAIFTSFILSLGVLEFVNRVTKNDILDFQIQWELIVGSVLVFLLGLYDDFKEITPPAKLVGQILAAAIIIFAGFSTQFFSPRIENLVVAQILNIILTFVWIVGITNAINLIDNMDGLAGGISLIGALFLSFFFFRADNLGLSLISMAIAGSVLGFLFFNFPPAKIFMGDSGSLFLGFTLAVLAIARQPQASNVLAVMGVPILIFLIPIVDTGMVFFTRILRGVSPTRGGKDHTSHRLVAFGFSERKVLLILYSVAIFSGVLAAFLESIRYWYSLVIVPIVIVTLTLFMAFLGGMKIVETQDEQQRRNSIVRFIGVLTYRRKVLEIIFDFFLIGIVYYLVFLFGFNFNMNDRRLELFISTFPIALFGVYLSFFVFGIYKHVWKYVSIEDFWKYLQASMGGVLIAAILLTFLLPDDIFLIRHYIYFFFFLVVGLTASRFSFRILQTFLSRQSKPEVINIAIYGTGDPGELTLQWCLTSAQSNFRPIGFFDEDPALSGKQIHGLPVFGSLEELPSVINRRKISGIIITSAYSQDGLLVEQITHICNENRCWVKKLAVELIDLC